MLIILIHPFYGRAYSTIRTIYVDDDNIDGPWDGSMEHPYQYIQDGINTSIDGDTIFVFNGTYQENILVSRRINLQGEKAITTIIKPMLGITINILCNDVTIKGFTISNQRWDPYAPYPGIYLFDINNCTISENIVDFNYNGILIFNSSDCFISNNYINWSYQLGIHIQKSSDINLLNNSLCNNSNGMTIEESTLLKICNNTFEKRGITLHGTLIAHWNTHDITDNTKDGKPIYYYRNANNITIPSDAGQILLANCSNINIEYITYYNDWEVPGYSDSFIQLGFSSQSNIKNNNISFQVILGSIIYMYNCTYNNISQNIINIGAGTGIELNSCTKNTILSNNIKCIVLINSHDNRIKDNNIYSVYLEASSNNTFYKNDIQQFFITGSVNSNIFENHILYLDLYFSSHNNICNNTEIKLITLFDTSYITLIDNNLSSGGGIIIRGISEEIGDVRGSHPAFWNTHTIEQNYINDKKIVYISNVQQGIVPEDASQVIIANTTNIIIRNLNINKVQRPIQIGYSSHTIIENNNIVGRDGCGIYFFSSENNIISNNSINSNDDGISLYFSMNNIIQNNLITNNYQGIYLLCSKKNMINKNNFQSNTVHAEFINRPEEPYNDLYYRNNEWSHNYWDDKIGFGPKIIKGQVLLSNFPISWIAIDWNPAKKPYDIPLFL